MKQILLLIAVILFFINPQDVEGQNITVSPNSSDFCAPVSVTYSVNPPSPGNSIEWWIEEYNNFNNSGGASLVWMIGSGLSIQIFSGSFGAGAWLQAREVDALGNIVMANQVSQLYKDNNPLFIPITSTSQFGNCYSLMVPPVFDPLSVFPWGQTRWAMWYKNGVALGVNSYFLQGPLLDSAWYEFKTVLTCGDTLSTGPFYFWSPSLPTISASSPTTICQGDTTILNASQSLTITGWSLDGVTIPNSNGKVSIQATQGGNYKVHVRYSTGGGGYCYLESNPFAVTVQPGAFITSTVNQACNGDSILLNCTAANSYVWKKNGNVISGANAQTLWVKTSGQYEVTTTGLTCNTSFIKTITFYANPTVAVSPSTAQDLCSGSAEVLIASGNNISTYSWLRNGTPLFGANASTLVLTKSGNYKCMVANVIGCTKTSGNVSITNVSSTSLPVKTLVLNPAASGKDAYISSDFFSTSTNFGNAPTMEVSNWYKYFRTAERGYLEFDLSSMPPSSPIVSANLKLWVDTISQKNVYANLPNSILFKRNIQPWSETGVIWYNYPDSSDFQFASVPCSTITSKSFINADVLNLVKHWSYLPSDNFGMLIQFHEFNQLSWASIFSSDHPSANKHPKLTIKYYYADIISSGTLNVCNGGSVSFSTNVGAYSYQWYKNNNPIAGATTSGYTATTAGVYHVVISVPSGCSVASVQKTVTVNAATPIDIVGDGSFAFCTGTTLTLSVDSVAGHTFQWKKNNVNIGGAIYSHLSVTTPGTYVVRVTNACGLISRDTVVCTEVINPSPGVTASGPLTFCAGQSVTFTAAVYPGVTHQWRKNNVDIVGATNSTYTATQSGTYLVKQTANGCVKYSAGKIVNVNCREGEFLAENYTVEVYPMPIQNGATIVVGGDVNYSEVQFQLFDLSGKLIHQFAAEGISTEFHKGSLMSGMYLLKTLSADKPIGINKVLLVD
ncbi:MAG: DNRLRE domain-containing protein [Bacteroidetes bacterium]|nr:DNRLRE domain-containing protein [Bacteroidota bacterium]